MNTATISAPSTVSSPPRLLTPRQIADRLACSYSMVLALIQRGALRAGNVGRLPRVRDVDLAAYIDRGGQR
jgi:excisionase family DNA binding protein